MGQRVVVGITGASGAPLAARCVRALLDLGHEVHLIVSETGHRTWEHEMGRPIDAPELGASVRGKLVVWSNSDFAAPVASGSFRHSGMAIIPCSTRTLGSIAAGISASLLVRAADACLKERRRLILVVRETPLSLIHIENMATVTRAGAVVLPASPGYYHHPATVQDLMDFVVARTLDQLGVEHQVGKRWRDGDADRVAGDGVREGMGPVA